MKIGDRVRIAQDLPRWVKEAQTSLAGKVGTIIELGREFHPSYDKGKTQTYVVKFDTPPTRWWQHQLPGLEWWFNENELELI